MINHDYDRLMKWLYEKDRELFDEWVVFCQEQGVERREKTSKDNRMLNFCLNMYKSTYPNTPQHILNAIDLIQYEKDLSYEDKMPAIRALLHERGGRIFRGRGNLWGQWKSKFEELENEFSETIDKILEEEE